ncbi:MAG: hypothetical protein ACFB5Z_16465 [Elainellaceae cyanobacterium]
MVSSGESGESALKYRTTIGWSLITSGIVTLLLTVLPGNSVWYGVLFLIVGGIILFVRRT